LLLRRQLVLDANEQPDMSHAYDDKRPGVIKSATQIPAVA
jgi:hypothetical protein